MLDFSYGFDLVIDCLIFVYSSALPYFPLFIYLETSALFCIFLSEHFPFSCPTGVYIVPSSSHVIILSALFLFLAAIVFSIFVSYISPPFSLSTWLHTGLASPSPPSTCHRLASAVTAFLVKVIIDMRGVTRRAKTLPANLMA